MIRYHDKEWGVPVHDDRSLFEFLVLEGAQAGLSWETILNKRENYRVAFDGFDVKKVARYDRRSHRRCAMPRRCCECRTNSAASTASCGSSWMDSRE
jgi:DNA-3-methyladenine glycosylase I